MAAPSKVRCFVSGHVEPPVSRVHCHVVSTEHICKNLPPEREASMHWQGKGIHSFVSIHGAPSLLH
eukprot:2362315-Amphidinium_carterae.1